MRVLRFPDERPDSSPEVLADLRRAAEYKAGRTLRDEEVIRLLDREWDALVARWLALGRWIVRLEEFDAVGDVPYRRRASGQAHDALWRAHQSAGVKASWVTRSAADRARSIRKAKEA